MTNKFNNQTDTSPIMLFDNQEDGVIVPFAFAKQLMGFQPNDCLTTTSSSNIVSDKYPAVKFNFIKTLRDYQQEIVPDAIDKLNKYSTLFLNLYTGFGKTVMGVYLSSYLQKITLVIYTLDSLNTQWEMSFKNFSDAVVWTVPLSNQWKDPPTNVQVILCMNERFSNIPKELMSKIGTVIYDEVPLLFTPSRIHCFLGIQPKYVIATSATIKRNDGMHVILDAVCGVNSTITKISKKSLSVYGYHTHIKIETFQGSNGKLDWNRYVTDISKNEARNLIIVNLIITNLNSHKILVMTNRVEHAEYLCTVLKQLNISSDYMTGKKKNYKNSQVLIAGVKKLGIGFDEETLCADYDGKRLDMLILTISTKTPEALQQWVGRILRADSPVVVHLVDDLTSCKTHWRIAKNYYKPMIQNGTCNLTETK